MSRKLPQWAKPSAPASKGPTLFFVDCEAYGAVPALGKLTEFGVVTWPRRQAFHGILLETTPDPENPAKPLPKANGRVFDETKVARDCDAWLNAQTTARKIMVSDNPAYDFMWMADFFWRNLGYNPFGHSARRISDFYAGLVHDWDESQKWKSLRITAHDHNPVHDALGNVEAFDRLLKGERP
jgi:hypothetical protein